MTPTRRLAVFTAAIVLAATANAQTGAPGMDRLASVEHRETVVSVREASDRGFVSTPLGANRYELTFSGQHFSSRDQLEGYLLYRAARVARDSGYAWFVLLHLPGDRGVDDHPARRNPSLGVRYGHWQPHWNYRLVGQEWQPWHPETGAPFWTDMVARRDVERFEVHAIIEGRHGAFPRRLPSAFNAARVIRDLETRFGSVGASAP